MSKRRGRSIARTRHDEKKFAGIQRARRATVRLTHQGKEFVGETKRLLDLRSNDEVTALALRIYGQLLEVYAAQGSLFEKATDMKRTNEICLPVPSGQSQGSPVEEDSDFETEMEYHLSEEDKMQLEKEAMRWGGSQSKYLRCALAVLGHVASVIAKKRSIWSRSEGGKERLELNEEMIEDMKSERGSEEDRAADSSPSSAGRIEEGGNEKEPLTLFKTLGRLRERYKGMDSKEAMEDRSLLKAISHYRQLAMEKDIDVKDDPEGDEGSNEIELAGDHILLALGSPICLISPDAVILDEELKIVSLDRTMYLIFWKDASPEAQAFFWDREPEFVSEKAFALLVS